MSINRDAARGRGGPQARSLSPAQTRKHSTSPSEPRVPQTSLLLPTNGRTPSASGRPPSPGPNLFPPRRRSPDKRASPSKSMTSEEEGAIDEDDEPSTSSARALPHSGSPRFSHPERAGHDSWSRGGESHYVPAPGNQRLDMPRERYQSMSGAALPARPRVGRIADTYRPGAAAPAAGPSTHRGGPSIRTASLGGAEDWDRSRSAWDRESRSPASAIDERERVRERWVPGPAERPALTSPTSANAPLSGVNAVPPAAIGGGPVMRAWGTGAQATPAAAASSAPPAASPWRGRWQSGNAREAPPRRQSRDWDAEARRAREDSGASMGDMHRRSNGS
jgi:hypothetical protein